jgi:hypothetical protein
VPIRTETLVETAIFDEVQKAEQDDEPADDIDRDHGSLLDGLTPALLQESAPLGKR